VKKSHASIPFACALRNCDHVGPERLGAGPSPPALRIRRIVVAPDADPELAELALDPDVAPPGILSGKAQDNLSELRVDRRPTRLPPRTERPLPTDQLSMPPE
jgi:hypothetical protein